MQRGNMSSDQNSVSLFRYMIMAMRTFWSVVRDGLTFLASFATVLIAFLQVMTFFGILKPSQIDDLNILPPGTAQRYLLAPYDEGVQKARERDYPAAIQLYQRVIDDPKSTVQEKVRAYDAMGYAYFRSGQLAAPNDPERAKRDYAKAKEALNMAMSLDQRAPLPHVNWIKVRCAEKADPPEIQTLLRELRSFAPAFGHDGELMRVCAYAGITPEFK